jgi:hypothetical protein
MRPPRWQEPARLALLQEYLPDGFVASLPDSFDRDTWLREAYTA